MSDCIAIIPARAGSKGIVDKNIMEFCGLPLITWSIRQALESQCVDEVYVSTDGERIGEVAQKAGANVIWRPNELATDTASSEEALIHAVNEIKERRKVSTVIFLQATSPIRTKTDIDNAYQTFIENEFDSLFSMSVLDDYCIWRKKQNDYESITYDFKNRGRRQERESLYLENGSIYIFKTHVLQQYKNRLGGKMGMYEMPFEHSYEIDSLKDIGICEYFMKRMMEGEENEKSVYER